jgi:hypothetical protein
MAKTTYQGRSLHPKVYVTETSGRKYILIKKKDGRIGRLYEGTKFHSKRPWKKLRL